jgi:hypothetical protein
MRYGVVVLWMLLWSVTSAIAQVSVGIGLPNVSIAINLPVYPQLVQVPDYPVYYAPQLQSNYFFYDGMYWVYQEDNWYASSWYNGPWGLVAPEVVPLFVLRIPVRYYRAPPVYFRAWRSDRPPRWGEHWGHEWEQRRSGWSRWNHSSTPAPAPLPVYQRRYSGDRYPRAEQQQVLRSQNYRYQPRDAVVRQHFQQQAVPRAPAPPQRGQQGAPQDRSNRLPDAHRPNSSPPPPGSRDVAPAKPPQRVGEDVRRPAPPQNPPKPSGPPVQDQRRQPQQGAAHPQQTPRPAPENIPQSRGASQEPGRVQGQEKERDRGDERGQERKGEERGQEHNR